MNIASCSEAAGRVAGLTIFVGADIDNVDRHVFIKRCGKRYARRINTVTGIAALREYSRVCVVDTKCWSEILGGMA